MTNMLTLNSANQVTFDVNIQGTASVPVVRCVLGESPSLMFPCTKNSDGKFSSVIDIPAGFSVGKYPFKIEVLLNGRLFTPINTSVDVTGADINVSPAINQPVDATPLPPVEPEIIYPVDEDKEELAPAEVPEIVEVPEAQESSVSETPKPSEPKLMQMVLTSSEKNLNEKKIDEKKSVPIIPIIPVNQVINTTLATKKIDAKLPPLEIPKAKFSKLESQQQKSGHRKTIKREKIDTSLAAIVTQTKSVPPTKALESVVKVPKVSFTKGKIIYI